MSKLNYLPLVRATVVEPFIEVSRQIGVPIEKYFRSLGLPGEFDNSPEMIMPEIPCWELAERIARVEGIDNFGLVAANTISHQSIVSVLTLFQGCSNLYQVLSYFCEVVPYFTNSAEYELEQGKDSIWFIKKGPRLIDNAIQVELFEVLGMIQIVQLTTGIGWRPADIKFTFSHQKNIENAVELNPSRIHFQKTHPAISIPKKLLMQPFFAQKVLSHLHENSVTPVEKLPEKFSDGLLKIIHPYLGDGKFTIHDAAETMGLSIRTFQRRLSSEQTSFSQIVDEARMIKATALLKEKNLKLLEITLMLGFENAPSFTRAFKRWSGLTPTEYRQLNS